MSIELLSNLTLRYSREFKDRNSIDDLLEDICVSLTLTSSEYRPRGDYPYKLTVYTVKTTLPKSLKEFSADTDTGTRIGTLMCETDTTLSGVNDAQAFAEQIVKQMESELVELSLKDKKASFQTINPLSPIYFSPSARIYDFDEFYKKVMKNKMSLQVFNTPNHKISSVLSGGFYNLYLQWYNLEFMPISDGHGVIETLDHLRSESALLPPLLSAFETTKEGIKEVLQKYSSTDFGYSLLCYMTLSPDSESLDILILGYLANGDQKGKKDLDPENLLKDLKDLSSKIDDDFVSLLTPTSIVEHDDSAGICELMVTINSAAKAVDGPNDYHKAPNFSVVACRSFESGMTLPLIKSPEYLIFDWTEY